jgi:hypothetical protein
MTAVNAQTIPAKTKLARPLCFAGGYTLDLYCDHENEAHRWNEFPHQFAGASEAECARRARLCGWVLHDLTRTATCPTCSGKG